MANPPSKPSVKLTVSVDVVPAAATVGGITPAVAGALAERGIDATSHHRLSLLKHAGSTWPGGRSAQQHLAARLYRYGRKILNSVEIKDQVAESFGAGGVGDGNASGDDNLELLEKGGTVRTRGPMAMPIEALQKRGAARRAARKIFREGVEQKRFHITKAGWIIRDEASKSVLVGRLVRSRTQKSILEFMAIWGRNWAKHEAKYNRLVDLALTAAGQSQLAKEVNRDRLVRSVKSAATRGLMENGLPRREARKVAAMAAQAARRQSERGRA